MDFTPPLKDGNLSVEGFHRVTPWAILIPSLGEEQCCLLRDFLHLELLESDGSIQPDSMAAHPAGVVLARLRAESAPKKVR
jgi:hypothetical protein